MRLIYQKLSMNFQIETSINFLNINLNVKYPSLFKEKSEHRNERERKREK
jgi:hypothetical protein